MAETVKIQGQLEIDQQRGVIYFHSATGGTVLRVCQLPTPIPEITKLTALLDIAHMYGVSWLGEPRIKDDLMRLHPRVETAV